MNKFYKRWQFWLYLVIVVANIFEVTCRNPLNISKWHSWLSMVLIFIFSYYTYTEVKENS